MLLKNDLGLIKTKLNHKEAQLPLKSGDSGLLKNDIPLNCFNPSFECTVDVLRLSVKVIGAA